MWTAIQFGIKIIRFIAKMFGGGSPGGTFDKIADKIPKPNNDRARDKAKALELENKILTDAVERDDAGEVEAIKDDIEEKDDAGNTTGFRFGDN